jgi:hypothetical protein
MEDAMGEWSAPDELWALIEPILAKHFPSVRISLRRIEKSDANFRLNILAE